MIRCPVCQYDLAAPVDDHRCPQCGAELRPPQSCTVPAGAPSQVASAAAASTAVSGAAGESAGADDEDSTDNGGRDTHLIGEPTVHESRSEGSIDLDVIYGNEPIAPPPGSAEATSPKDTQPLVASQGAVGQDSGSVESSRLTSLADARLAELQQTGLDERRDDDLFEPVAALLQEALDRWPGNQTARRLLSKTRVAQAEAALRRGDFDQGVALLSEDDPDQRSLLARLRAALADRQRRSRRQRIAVFTLGGAVVAGAILVGLLVR